MLVYFGVYVLIGMNICLFIHDNFLSESVAKLYDKFSIVDYKVLYGMAVLVIMFGWVFLLGYILFQLVKSVWMEENDEDDEER
ncbi:hypothetical protein [Bacillus cereus]|uniref:hypothetical protein n=1 Tax=Bacillus cereus TaxID=1396 RepID=UPI0021806A01|nr:hypothetical protein [Bacillus cereus]UWJ21241.1 hypothetical protein FORC10_p001 [Bacillus cereus]